MLRCIIIKQKFKGNTEIIIFSVECQWKYDEDCKEVANHDGNFVKVNGFKKKKDHFILIV